MEVIAKLNRLRMSPRKVRLVAGLIRRMKIAEAETQLKFLNKAAAEPMLKLLLSAKANAEHNHKLDPNTLWISHLTVDGGKTLKRWRPRAYGRAGAIRKRTSHITLKLSDGPRPEKKTKKAYVPRNAKNVKPATKAKVEAKKTENQE
ncbi:MAG: 50S ribosomal protein L22 [Patescibacteria group bacterium]|nr:50S ribosomal protein L22 [Patescibacteria group bacterium]